MHLSIFSHLHEPTVRFTSVIRVKVLKTKRCRQHVSWLIIVTDWIRGVPSTGHKWHDCVWLSHITLVRFGLMYDFLLRCAVKSSKHLLSVNFRFGFPSFDNWWSLRCSLNRLGPVVSRCEGDCGGLWVSRCLPCDEPVTSDLSIGQLLASPVSAGSAALSIGSYDEWVGISKEKKTCCFPLVPCFFVGFRKQYAVVKQPFHILNEFRSL